MKQAVRYILIFSLLCSLVPVQAMALDEGVIAPTEQVIDEHAAHEREPAEVNPPEERVEVSLDEQLPALVVQPTIQSVLAAPIVEVPLAPAVIAADGPVIVSALQVSSGLVDAVELVSVASKPVDLSDWRIEVVYTDGVSDWSCLQQLSGFMLVKQQATLISATAMAVSEDGADGSYAVDFQCGQTKTGQVLALDMWAGDARVEHIRLTDGESGVWSRKGTTASKRTGVFADDFKRDSGYQFHATVLYFPPAAMPLVVTEVYSNPQPCTPIDTSALCNRYIKVYNPSEFDVDLRQYRLRAGTQTTSATSANTSTLRGVVLAGETVLLKQTADGVPLYLASADGSVWFQDMYGLRDYSSGVAPYGSANTVKNTGMSWAYDLSDKVWKWSVPSPDTAENVIRLPEQVAVAVVHSVLVPCRSDQYRSEETNRCRSITTSTTQVPCKNGQYRSEETNRCRNLSLAGSTLTPCKDSQYRSEETNRCRTVAGVATSRVPCRDNQYRSEETNRCRNLTAAAIPDADFAVTPVKDSGRAFVGWWALGGIGLLAVGYGTWEWRREITRGLRKVRAVTTRHR